MATFKVEVIAEVVALHATYTYEGYVYVITNKPARACELALNAETNQIQWLDRAQVPSTANIYSACIPGVYSFLGQR